MKTLNLWIATVLLAFAIAIFISSFYLPSPYSSPFDLGIGFFPKAVSLLLAACCLRLIYQSLSFNTADFLEIVTFNTKPIVLTLAIMVLYFILIVTIGYFPATLISCILFCLLLKIKSKLTIGLLSLLLSGGLYLLFENIFLVQLPTGLFN